MDASTIGNYALFAGGYTTKAIDTVDAYDISLTRSTPTALSAARYSMSAATVGNYALFACGSAASGVSAVVDVYTVI